MKFGKVPLDLLLAVTGLAGRLVTSGRVQPVPERNRSQSWVAGVRRRIPFYLLAAFLLELLTAVVTFIYLEQLRASVNLAAAARIG